MLDSQAWQDLSPNAVYLYISMKRKYVRRAEGVTLLFSNKNDISLVKNEYSQFRSNRNRAKGGSWSTSTFNAAIDELINHGFIILVKSQYAERKCNLYGFSSMWKYYGTAAFEIKPEQYRTLKQQHAAENEQCINSA